MSEVGEDVLLDLFGDNNLRTAVSRQNITDLPVI